jgi:hypothetical protein
MCKNRADWNKAITSAKKVITSRVNWCCEPETIMPDQKSKEIEDKLDWYQSDEWRIGRMK